jgi:arylsulfatase A-like enzyme
MRSSVASRGRAIPAALLVLLTLACPGADSGTPGAAQEAPHGLLLIVLDTLRADGLSVYGNPRATSPALDRLAERGVVFEQAVSHAPWTLPAFVGLLSGSYPSPRVFADKRLQVALVEVLREAGYATAAFTEGGFASNFFGFGRGFDTYWELEGKVALTRDGELLKPEDKGGVARTVDSALSWLQENGGRRFFLMLHTYEIHFPYTYDRYAQSLSPGRLGQAYEPDENKAVRRGELQPSGADVAYVRALYDAGVRVADHQLERLFEGLEALGLADRTVVIVTSDHGEAVGERDPRYLGRHGDWLYDELLHIPLILHDPRVRHPVRRVSTQVRLIDVLPTLLDLAGATPPAETDGRSLLPLVRGEESGDRLAFGRSHPIHDDDLQRTSVRDGRHKLIANLPPRPPEVPPLELYDLAEDARERTNVADARPAVSQPLGVALRGYWRRTGDDEDLALDIDQVVPGALREQLRALGYLDD